MDKNEMALGVLEEIQQLIQDRIGGSIAPEAPKVDLEEEKPPMEAAPAEGGDELSPEEAEELAGMYDSEGVGENEAEGGEMAEEDPLKKKKGM